MFTISIADQTPIRAKFIGTIRTDDHLGAEHTTQIGREFLDALRTGDANAADRIFTEIGFGLIRDIPATEVGALAAEVMWSGVRCDLTDEDGEFFGAGVPVLIQGDVALVKTAGNRINVLRVLPADPGSSTSPASAEMASALGKWLDDEIRDNAPECAEPAAVRQDADDAHKECDALIRKLRDLIKDDRRESFKEFLDITQTGISTLVEQRLLANLHRSVRTAYDRLDALAENFWRHCVRDQRHVLLEPRRAAWNLMRSVRSLERGEEFTPEEPPLLNAHKKKAKKPSHWPDPAKAEKDVRRRVAEMCSSITTEMRDDGRAVRSYKTSDGRVEWYGIRTPPGLWSAAEEFPLSCIFWNDLEAQGIINRTDYTDDAVSQLCDVHRWVESEIESFIAARKHNEQAA